MTAGAAGAGLPPRRQMRYSGMMNRILASGLTLLLLAPLPARGGSVPPPGPPRAAQDQVLDPHFQEWLNMVAAIAAPEELEGFRRLSAARDRDLFVRLFWRQRDPTPGTEANEYRDEIERRFRHVNEYFGRGTTRPGWMTDMGRIYMILGEPNSQESFEQVPGVQPAQVWSYVGDAGLGLPPQFNVTFYKPNGVGEWRIYEPATTGPAALLTEGDQYGSADSRRIYRLLRQRAPNLAGPAFSMIPGQGAGETMPSLRNSRVLADIQRSPLRRVDPAYAADFRGYSGYVRVESSVRYVENSHALAVLKEDLWGFNVIALSIKPKKLTIGQNAAGNGYELSFDLTVSLKQGEAEVYSFRRHYELPMTPAQMEVVRSGGVVLHDSFPVVPGRYQLAVFLQNPASREFCFCEEAVEVPAAARPLLATPVLGFKAQATGSNFFCPYKAGALRLAVDPDRVFAAGQVPFLWLGAYHVDNGLRREGRIAWEIKGLSESRPFRQRNERRLDEFPERRQFNAVERLAAAPLEPGYYSLAAELLDGGGNVLDRRETTFQVSPLPGLAQPSELYSQAQVDGPGRMDFIVGRQLHALGDEERAIYSYEKSLQAEPDLADARAALLEILLSRGEYERVAREAGRLPGTGRWAFSAHALRGRALFALGRFAAARDELTAAHAVVDTDLLVLNLIGRASLELGDNEQAARAFTASLAIRGDQPEITALLQTAQDRVGRR